MRSAQLGLVAAFVLVGAANCSSDESNARDTPMGVEGDAGDSGTGGNTSGGRTQAGTGGRAQGVTGGETSTGGRTAATGGRGGGGRASAGETSTGGKAAAGETSTGGKASSGSGGSPSGTSSAAEVAERLGRPARFLIGMGNDLAEDHNEDGAYTLGVTLDIHYAYMVGLLDQGGWPDWNPGGYFANILADTARDHGVVPMFTLYSMAAWGEANTDTLTNAEYMQPYWDGAKLLFERLAEFGDPAIVQFEPDFWAFVQQASDSDPESQDVLVSSLAPDCADLPDNLVGMGKCLVKLARDTSPNVLVGFHASGWANPEPEAIVDFLSKIGAAESDFVTTDTLDRDAGCFEAHTDEACQRNDGPWYWDETNQTSPNFHEHLAWVKVITDGLGKPMLWWQTPFGVPSDTPGGESGRYRDNRVKYIFEHTEEFVEAGGVGAVFGVGAGNQTYITTDGGQFQNAVTAYFASPTPL